MKRKKRLIVEAAALLLAVATVTACVSLAGLAVGYETIDGLKDEPLDQGKSHRFAADYEAVVSAAREVLPEVWLQLYEPGELFSVADRLHLAEDYPVNDSTWAIYCGSGYLDAGWVARMVVQRLGEGQTVVRVIARARNPIVIEIGDYSQVFFAALMEKLEGKLDFFAVDYEAVVSATREGAQEMGFALREDYSANDSTWVIRCEKYGRSLRVVVQRLGEKQTAVRAISSPRSPTDPFEMEDFYRDIFAALFEKLEGQPHFFAADYEAVVSVAREAVQEEGFSLREDYAVNDSTWVILCERYGRFLRVVVRRLGERQIAVRVIFRRGEGVEVWRLENDSQDIFAALIEKLEGKSQETASRGRQSSHGWVGGNEGNVREGVSYEDRRGWRR
jgi:hypothetical protein